MIKRTKSDLKWSVIAIAAIITILGLTGCINCFTAVVPLFWIYVMLDKLN